MRMPAGVPGGKVTSTGSIRSTTASRGSPSRSRSHCSLPLSTLECPQLHVIAENTGTGVGALAVDQGQGPPHGLGLGHLVGVFQAVDLPPEPVDPVLGAFHLLLVLEVPAVQGFRRIGKTLH